MALSAGTNLGFSLMKAKKNSFCDAMEFQLASVPLTCCHKVGIVAGYSNSEIVNPVFTQDIRGVSDAHGEISPYTFCWSCINKKGS